MTTERSKPLPSLSVFFPAFNDALSIPDLVHKAYRVAGRVTDDFEVIVVNDGSQDATADALSRLRVVFPSLRVVTHPLNRGYGGALQSGFAAALKEWVFYTDGDGQYDPADLESLASGMRADIDLVNGYKLKRRDTLARAILGALYNFAVRRLFGLRLRDIDCDFRLIRRSKLQSIRLVTTSGAVCVELIKKLQDSDAGMLEVGVAHYPRLHGSSQFFEASRIVKTLQQVIGLWWALVVMKKAEQPCHELH